MTHAQLLEACLDEFAGTPEELGHLLHDATWPPPLLGDTFHSREYVEQRRASYSLARYRLGLLPHGRELLRVEERVNRVGCSS